MVDQVPKVLCHANLPHELVLVPVHARQSTNVRENILQGVCQLEGVDIAKTELNVGVND